MNPNTVSSKCKFLQALPVSSEKADLSALLVEMTGMALSRSLHAACGLGRDDRGTLRSVEMTWVSFRAEHASCHFEGSLPLCHFERSTKCAVEKSAHPTWLDYPKMDALEDTVSRIISYNEGSTLPEGFVLMND